MGVLGSDLVVVGDSKANESRVFDRGGAFVRAFGRGGSGPGEFSRVLWSVHALGDRILATDNGGEPNCSLRPGLNSSAAGDAPRCSGWWNRNASACFAARAMRCKPSMSPGTQPRAVVWCRAWCSTSDAGLQGPRTRPWCEAPRCSPDGRRSRRTTDLRADERGSGARRPYLSGPLHRYRIACFNANGTPLFVIELCDVREPRDGGR